MAVARVLRDLIRKWWFSGRAPIPVYDVSDEDVETMEAERTVGERKPKEP